MGYVKPSISQETSLHIAVDWIELRLLQSGESDLKTSSLSRMFDTNADEEDPDARGQEDSCAEDCVGHWLDEIERRKNALKGSYPFSVNGGKIILDKEKLKNPGGLSYLFCLFLSHPKNNDAIDGCDFLNLTNNDRVRDHFQIIATIAAGGYLRGHSVSFGFPRHQREGFIEALQRVTELNRDGAKLQRPPHPAAPSHVKDAGIDLISWIPSNDDLPGKILLIGQVASGENWAEKPLSPNILNSLEGWLHPNFASKSNMARGLFIPFCIEPTENSSLFETFHYLCANKIDNIIFHRDRIPFYVGRTFTESLHKDKELTIERVDDFDRVSDWVKDALGRLRNPLAAI